MYILNQHELVAAAFLKGYSYADLKESFFSLTRKYVASNMELLVAEGVPDDIILLGTESSLAKNELSLFVTLPYLNSNLFQAFRNFLPKDVGRLMDELVWEEKMTQKEIELKLDLKVYEVTKSRYSGYEQVSLKKDFNFFRHANIHQYSTLKKANYTLYIEPSVRRIITIYYDAPSGSTIIPVKGPVSTDFTYNYGQINILLELPRLLAYAQQGHIKTSAKGKPQVSTLGKMQRKLNLQEFYPKAPEKSIGLMRTNLLAGLITTIGKGISTADPAVLLKTLIQSYYTNSYITIQKALTYLKGTGYIDDYYIEKVEHHIVHLISQLPENEWVAIENILKYLKFSFIDIRPVKSYTARNKLYYEYEGIVQYDRYSYTENKHYIDNDRYDSAITIPTLKGAFFLFSAFGLLDIAYDQVDGSVMGKTCHSPFDGLRFIRLNKLGAYIAGQRARYDMPEEVSKSTIELSEDSLTIISDKNDPTAEVVLEPYTEKVTPNRFRTDFSIFLKGVKDKKELADKINLFKQSVTQKVPTNWQTFFDQLNHKIDPLKKVSGLEVFKIPTDNPDLIKLIARDSKLKELCFKGEGYHVLVEKKKMARFKARLREFGYLLSK